MRLDDAAIARCFDPITLRRGQQYWREGRVVDAHWDPATREIWGTVEGGGEESYDQSIVVSEPAGRLRIVGNCTCPIARNCKHVAAVLLKFAEEGGELLFDEKGVAATAPDLPSELNQWLNVLEERLAPPGPEPEYPDELRYVVRLLQSQGPDRYAALDLLTTRKARHANPAKRHHLSMNAIRANAFPRFIGAADRSLIRAIHRSLPAADQEVASFRMEGSDGEAFLLQALKTNRCRWATLEGPVLSLGTARKIKFHWVRSRNGVQALAWSLHPSGVLLPISTPYYVDGKTGECGPVDGGLPGPALLSLLRAPAVLPEHTRNVRESMREFFPDRPELWPEETSTVVDAALAPKPTLRISRRSVAYRGLSSWREANLRYEIPVARLRFEYDGIEAGNQTDIRIKQPDGSLRIIRRHPEQEMEARRELERRGWRQARFTYGFEFDGEAAESYVLVPDEPGRGVPTQLQPYYHFLDEAVPLLRSQGWAIDLQEEPIRVPEQQISWEVDTIAPEAEDWFRLDLGLNVEGNRVDLRQILVQAVQLLVGSGKHRSLEDVPASASIYHELSDGRIVTVPVERLRPLVQSLVEIFGAISKWPDELRLPKDRAAELELLDRSAESGAFSLSLPDRIRELKEKLASFERIPEAKLPESFRGDLRPYQLEGVSWLQFLREFGFGGILADDMGLGKTVQTLAHLLIESDGGRLTLPALIVAPTSTLPNWRREAEKFALGLRVLTLQGADRHARFSEIADHDLVLTTYPLLARDRARFQEHEFYQVVLDEAQNIKNPLTATAKAACALRTAHRLCLSGTPVENNLEELWSLLHFGTPGLLGSLTEFRKEFRGPIENQRDKETRARLARRVRPFILRRTKEQVAKELPLKTEVIDRVELQGAQRDLYESVRLTMDKRVRELIADQGIERSRIEILQALLKLRQVCCDPRLVKLPSTREIKASAKLDRLMDMLAELREEGRRVLVFSQFTSMLDLIETRLQEQEWQWVRISGETKDRETPVRRFQAGEIPLFLISLRAGGTGLNLTAADTVIHYDPWWNPAVERQATDRAHRIGQDKSVFVFKLVAEGTVEEKILELQERKAELAGALFEESADAAAKLTAEDIRQLFE